ncbi:3-deoxy-7-phosphoheptulonate synthase [Vibrio mimicus]|uniref:3-deoxy-7-phosphoheptulonate synthase n=1 Tax=Vibrio mimicus TaxID=674 RepID=UPI002F935694
MDLIRLQKSNIRQIITPEELEKQIPLPFGIINQVNKSRGRISDIIEGRSRRILVIVGPCSIHDEKSAIEYAEKLSELSKIYSDDLEIVMRVYFEKPRTRIGWKGLIYDPYLNESSNFNDGICIAKRILINISKLGLSAGTEFLEPLHANYLHDLISWGAIGARTTESQLHRQMASSFRFPIGFKNGTNGNVDVAIDAIVSAASKHTFLSLSRSGTLSEVISSGNNLGHLILRGGIKPNYDEISIHKANKSLRVAEVNQNLLVDCSHGNCQKNYANQLVVLDELCRQISLGKNYIVGVMLESHLEEGSQPINRLENLKYGQSITDPCIGWKDTVIALKKLAEASATRSQRKTIENI